MLLKRHCNGFKRDKIVQNILKDIINIFIGMLIYTPVCKFADVSSNGIAVGQGSLIQEIIFVRY